MSGDGQNDDQDGGAEPKFFSWVSESYDRLPPEYRRIYDELPQEIKQEIVSLGLGKAIKPTSLAKLYDIPVEVVWVIIDDAVGEELGQPLDPGPE